mgnify:CR=1 FL=1
MKTLNKGSYTKKISAVMVSAGMVAMPACKPDSQTELAAINGESMSIGWDHIESTIKSMQDAAPGSELSFESLRKIPAAKIFSPELKSKRRIQFGDVEFDDLDQIIKNSGQGYVEYVGQFRTLGDYLDSQGIKSNKSVSITAFKDNIRRLKTLIREQQLASLKLDENTGLALDSGNALALGGELRNCSITGAAAVGSVIGTTAACVMAAIPPFTIVAAAFCGSGILGSTGAVNGAYNNCKAYDDKKKANKSQAKNHAKDSKDNKDGADTESSDGAQDGQSDKEDKDKKG